MDLRGLGNSVEEGLPIGDTKDFKRHLQDLDEVADIVKKIHPGLHLFMLGHSLGCNYILLYASTHSAPLDGLILLSPAAKTNAKIPARDLLGFVLAFIFTPGSSCYALNRAMSHDVKNSKEYKALMEDPLIPKKLRLRYFGRIRSLFTKVFVYASRVDRPTLI